MSTSLTVVPAADQLSPTDEELLRVLGGAVDLAHLGRATTFSTAVATIRRGRTTWGPALVQRLYHLRDNVQEGRRLQGLVQDTGQMAAAA